MKKIKIFGGITFLVLFFFVYFFSFSRKASASVLDVCNSEFVQNFGRICPENKNFSFFDISTGVGEKTEVENFKSMAASQNDIEEAQMIIDSDREWEGTISFFNYVIIIKPGATLTVRPGTKISLKNSMIGVLGTLKIEGTKDSQVVIENGGSGEEFLYYIASGYDFSSQSFGKIEASYADISGGGIVYDPDNQGDLPIGAITSEYADFKIENCNIHDNKIGISTFYAFGDITKVNRTKFSNNEVDVMANFDYESLPPQFATPPNFEYNWWGGLNGPEKNENGEYEKIIGKIDLRHFSYSEDFHDPTIIIPGILGSEKENGEWKIDPVFHIYDNLYEEFIQEGFVADEDIFTFPYEWRDSNIENAKLLRDKINEIKRVTKIPKVDVVAHSMGGLLVREYIESDYYQEDVDQLITLGTPHNGAPEAYLKWEAGAFTFGASDIYFKRKFSQEAEESGYDDVFHYIRERPILSVQELLPVYSYLYDVDNNNQLRTYSFDYPRNEFLENLNLFENKEKLKKVFFYKIIGNVDSNESTISGFKIINEDMGEYWEHGYPQGFEMSLTDRGMVYDIGDRTVPLESAKSESIEAEKTLEINSEHISIPTDAQKDILEILTGLKPSKEIKHSLLRDIFTAMIHSPIDIQIIAPDGKKVGKDFESGGIINEIPGAFYSGFETENEFLTIPNPQEGEYELITQGTGIGDYSVEISRIFENGETGEAKEILASISGSAQFGDIEENKIQVFQEEIKIVEEDVTIGSIIEKINLCYKQGLIRKNDRNFLVSRLNIIKEMQEMIGKFRENVNIKEKAKEKIIENFEKLINLHLDFIENYIRIRSGEKSKNKIDSAIAAELIKKINSLKYD